MPKTVEAAAARPRTTRVTKPTSQRVATPARAKTTTKAEKKKPVVQRRSPRDMGVAKKKAQPLVPKTYLGFCCERYCDFVWHKGTPIDGKWYTGTLKNYADMSAQYLIVYDDKTRHPVQEWIDVAQEVADDLLKIEE